MPGLLPLLDLPLGLVQVSEEASQVGAAGGRGEAAEHWRRTGGKAAAHKVPNAARPAVQAWGGGGRGKITRPGRFI